MLANKMIIVVVVIGMIVIIIKSLIIKLVEVPISVNVPPKIAA